MERKTLKLGFFPKAYMFELGGNHVVIEKERQVVCVYATGPDYSPVFAAVPLCHPKYLKHDVFVIQDTDANSSLLLISVGELRILIDFAQQKVSCNKGLSVYGSEIWGRDCSTPWSREFDSLFVG